MQTPAQTKTPAQLQPSVFAEDGKLIPMPRAELKDILEIDDAVATASSKSIRIAYEKYIACNAAVRLYDTVVAEGRWPKQYQRVTVTEIRQLFISKTVWHSLYVPCFQDITKYDDMVAWLEGTGDDVPADKTLWGFEKSTYICSDLKAWLEARKKKDKKEQAIAKKEQAKKEKEKEQADAKKGQASAKKVPQKSNVKSHKKK
jgi:hypothetical protein